MVVLHELGPFADLIQRAVVLNEGRVTYDGPPSGLGPHGHPDLDVHTDGVHHHESRTAPLLRPEVRAPLDRRGGGA